MLPCPWLPSSPTLAAGADSDGGFPICLGRGGQKESRNGPELSTRADLPARLQGPPGDSPAPACPLHSERVPPATGRKPEGCSSQCHPSSAKPEEAKEQRRAVTFYHQRGPIKAFHGEFHGESLEFHGDHFILMVSTDKRVLLHVREVQACR